MKENDIVICINIQKKHGTDSQEQNLTLNKKYKIIERADPNKNIIQIRDDNEQLNWYYLWRFKPYLKEERKEKLLNILKND